MESFRRLLRAGELNSHVIQVEVPVDQGPAQPMGIELGNGMTAASINDIFGRFSKGRKEKQELPVEEVRGRACAVFGSVRVVCVALPRFLDGGPPPGLAHCRRDRVGAAVGYCGYHEGGYPVCLSCPAQPAVGMVC